MERLENHGIRPVEAPRLPRHKIIDVVEHRSGIRLQPLRAWPAAGRTDATLAVWEHWAELPALLRRVPGPYRRHPLYSMVCWAAEDLRSGDERTVTRVRRVIEASDLIFYLSGNQEEIFLAHGARPEQLVEVTFGVPTAFFTGDVGASRDVDVLAVGVDRGRDYKTLLAAAGTDLLIDVLTVPERLRALTLPQNVRPLGVLRPDRYRDLLQRTKVVVVPTHDFAYPTGQTVALNAAAAGCAVVVSRTDAMSEYFSPDDTASMPGVGEVDELREALVGLLHDPERRLALASRGQAHVRAHHTSDLMWDQIGHAIRAHLAAR
ncbi:glycosyltransferase family protein [Nocardioides sp. Root122]|nr:glycosyltransferase [Nocardioides sp. Root122]